jgi:hypothetical protein
MHHCKKFYVAMQQLFAATQQKGQNPYFLIKNRGLRKYIMWGPGLY